MRWGRLATRLFLRSSRTNRILHNLARWLIGWHSLLHSAGKARRSLQRSVGRKDLIDRSKLGWLIRQTGQLRSMLTFTKNNTRTHADHWNTYYDVIEHVLHWRCWRYVCWRDVLIWWCLMLRVLNERVELTLWSITQHNMHGTLT